MSVFDRILASTPLDKTAAQVTSQPGCDDEPEHWNTIPPLKKGPPDPGFSDLTGFSYGRLTVIGLHDSKRGDGSNGATWVVRCVCGLYETRRTAHIKKASPDACCNPCGRKKHAAWLLKTYGPRPITDFFKPVGASE
jgi:hypothetical protein